MHSISHASPRHIFTLATVSSFSAAIAQTKPNVVMIFTDDMDYGDISRFSNALPATADLRDIAVGQAGNMFGLDVANGRIIIMRGADQAMFSVS